MGQLILQNMEFYAHHGHFREEQVIGGTFSVDLIVETNLSKPSESDELSDAVDYSRIYEVVKNEIIRPSKLLEHLAKRIIDAVYTVSSDITKVTVTVSKLNPAIGGKMDKFSVLMSR